MKSVMGYILVLLIGFGGGYIYSLERYRPIMLKSVEIRQGLIQVKETERLINRAVNMTHPCNFCHGGIDG